MNTEKILCEMEEKCNMEFARPAREESLQRLEETYPAQARYLKELYHITDGVGINVPGTVIYPVSEVLERGNGRNSSDELEIGFYSFGDCICMTMDGRIRQLNHETGEVFLEWKSLNQFLLDELSNI